MGSLVAPERVVVYGAGASLARPLIHHYHLCGAEILAQCKTSYPQISPEDLETDPAIRVVFEGAPVMSFEPDLLITLPAVVDDSLLTEMDEGKWGRVLEGTLTSVYKALHHWLPRMKNGGNVVVVGSIAGSLGGYGCCNYAAAKAGLVGLVRGAANEVARRNIKINLLELGFMELGLGAALPEKIKDRTIPAIPLRRFGAEHDFIQAVNFLATTDYMTGNTLTLAGGMR